MAVQVGSGMVWHGSVRYVWVRCGLSRRSRRGAVRHGAVCFGMVWLGAARRFWRVTVW